MELIREGNLLKKPECLEDEGMDYVEKSGEFGLE